ncbi:hypothetical protein [Clostridium oryzae]|uniref:Uncharacterized protein n=1 Tax=Clostridium oryzae TaxID=1450648 RepID=A0A1V4I468_9CLOT|nr:hypothetical protein [Clostridium oryzae]OPJ54772.1 hypothetical protein CLORY_45120 [Clostridium oryzae]
MEHNDINLKLQNAQQGIMRLNKIDAMLEQLKDEQKELEKRTNELKKILQKESKDVQKIENKSIKYVFYSILGTVDEHIDKELKEELAAKLKYQQSLKDLDDVVDRISKLSVERYNYVNCQKEYEQLYEQKKEMLIQNNGNVAKRILNLTDEVNASKGNLKEIEEALYAGQNVLNSLEIILDKLDSAEDWGTFDMLGGGLFVGMAKHSDIDDAQDEAENVQKLLRQFRTELVDVKIDENVEINIDEFAKFADVFFDGLIADWYMQSKINESQNNIVCVKEQVTEVIQRLNKMEAEEKSKIEDLQFEVKHIIEIAN